METFNVVIEIPLGESLIKYEFDKDLGMLKVDRFLSAPMYYPCNYGYIPSTLGGDGDPLDALVVCPHKIIAGAFIECKTVGMLVMEDESGLDEKIIAVPKVHPNAKSINDLHDLDELLKSQIKHFFENYKGLEKNKWVKIKSWESQGSARSLINKSLV